MRAPYKKLRVPILSDRKKVPQLGWGTGLEPRSGKSSCTHRPGTLRPGTLRPGILQLLPRRPEATLSGAAAPAQGLQPATRL